MKLPLCLFALAFLACREAARLRKKSNTNLARQATGQNADDVNPVENTTNMTAEQMNKTQWVAETITQMHATDQEHENIQMVVGVLTIPDNFVKRNMMRQYMEESRVDKRIKVYFLFDKPFAVREAEKGKRDMLILNANYVGRANHFGEKLVLFYRRALNLHPTAKFFVKMDDDVLVCLNAVFHDLMNTPRHNLAYYGVMYHGNHAEHIRQPPLQCFTDQVDTYHRMDEMFVALGRTLVQRIAARPYCSDPGPGGRLDRVGANCEYSARGLQHLIDTNFGGTSLGVWLSIYHDINVVCKNKQFVHKFNDGLVREPLEYLHGKYRPETFCRQQMLYHKASPQEQAKFAVDQHRLHRKADNQAQAD